MDNCFLGEIVYRKKTYVPVLRRVFFAGLMATAFLLLGLFSGLGYRLYMLKEIGFVPHSRYGYADARFKCDIVYNPVLYPVYWLMGSGRRNGTFAILYFPEGYTAGEHAMPIFGLSEKDRRDAYLMNMLAWGIGLNFFALFSIAVAIEITKQRGLYFAVFGAMLGFVAFEMMGVIAGAIIGSMLALLLLKLWPENPVMLYWRSFWTENV